jgi:tripartite-type tricarboxylate transporter receptor subunit TctC
VLLANPSFPANDVPGLIAAAKASPGKFNFGSAGVGAGNHVVMEMLLDATGMRMVHVPHRDSAMSVVTGESDLSMVPAATAIPLAASGKGKPLGVSLPQRIPALPQVAAIAETVPGYSGDAWHGLLAPAGTPASIVERLAAETARVLAMPDVHKRLTDIGLTPVGDTPAAFAATIRADHERWGAAIRKANIKLD